MAWEDYTEEQLCLVCLAATAEIGPVSINRLWRTAQAGGEPLAAVFGLALDELRQGFGLGGQAAAAVASLCSPFERARHVLEAIDAIECRPVFADHPEYPPKLALHLGLAAPAVLFVRGELAVLHGPCLAIVGSRRPSEAAEHAARTLAADVAASGVTVVSGGAIGIDTAAHRAALGAGATAVVASCGVGRFTWRGISDDELPAGRWCVLSQFPPQDGWKRQYALMRNRTIVAASDAVVAFDPRDTGGTWHSCMGALGMRKPLFVCSSGADSSQRRGLRRLVRLGAAALDPDHMPGPAELQQLVRDYAPPPEPAQVPLFDPLEGVG